MIFFGPWEPDKGPFNPDTIDTVSNMAPISNGWGPQAGLDVIGNSLGATCCGAWYVRRTDGTFRFMAGTRTGLYEYNSGTGNWDDISGPSGPYNVRDGDVWRILQFGDNFLVVNIEDPPQFINVDTGTAFADLAGSPPQARYIWSAGDFVVLGYLKVGSDEFPQDIHWSGLNDATYWTIDRKKGSDRQRLPYGDEIMGGLGFPNGARIISRRAKWAMSFVGGQFVFNIDVIDPARGSVSPQSIVQVAANDYLLLDEDGWYRGDQRIAIGAQRVDNMFLADVDLDSLDLVQGAVDPFEKACLFTYLDGNGAYKQICYDWQLDRWYPGSANLNILVSTVTPGLTLEDDDEFADNVDAVGAPSLDSRLYKGGKPVVGGFNASDNRFYIYGGISMAGSIETPTMEHFPDTRAFVSGAKLKGNPGNSSTMQVITGNLPEDVTTVSAAVSRSSRTGLYPMRADAFFHRYRVNTAAGDTTFTHIHGISVNAQPAGEA